MEEDEQRAGVLAAARVDRLELPRAPQGRPHGRTSTAPEWSRARRDQGQRLLRPRARRRLSTRRPPLVAIRARNPWRRLRRKLLGWYVRFIAAILPSRRAFAIAKQ